MERNVNGKEHRERIACSSDLIVGFTVPWNIYGRGRIWRNVWKADA